jgi:Arc/MetJ-type ribon-helix-helix transcriptional regulator
MTQAFPPELQELVRLELATGKYESESAVLLEAMKLLRNRESHLRQFRETLKERLDRLDRGDAIDLNDISLQELFDEIEREVDTELTSKSQ